MISRTTLTIRSAREIDLDDLEEMINDFVKGHPAEGRQRSRAKWRGFRRDARGEATRRHSRAHEG
jgi:hypothetical protein